VEGVVEGRCALKYEAACGGGTLGFEPPRGMEVEVPAAPALPEEPADVAARRALAAPSGSPPLEVRARGAADAVVVVPDATRACPVAEILPLLLDALEKAGIPPAKVTVVAALGLHRGTTGAERAAMLGASAGRGVAWADHDPKGNLKDGGVGPQGAPLRVNGTVAAAGFVASLGVVEPHQYAGFSGGWKTVGIGCAGAETIAFTHSPRFLDHPRCRPGIVEGNPFLDVVKENARRGGLRFALNFVIGRKGGIVAAAAGDPGVAHRLLSARARDAFAFPVKTPADVAVAGVGAPKDANLYQATRAATNLVLGPLEAVRPGGTILVLAKCPEGIGSGAAETRFAEALRRGVAAVLADRSPTLQGGEQRAYAVAKVLQSRRIVIVGSSIPKADLEAMGLGSAATVEEALAEAAGRGARRLLVAADALRALPVPAGSGGRP
jgi:nickel-dependent lactate racemase